MGISAAQVKELRDRTGAGMMDCKKALQETDGDMEAAIDVLRSRGAAKAAKREGKEATEGVVASYVDESTGVGALVEVNCETDFVARNDEFQALAGELAEHVAKHESTDGEGAGADLDGNAFQGGDRTIEQVVTQTSAKTGEKVVFRNYARFDSDGVLGAYVHMGGRIGVLVELDPGASEELAKDVAMHIAASRPLAVTPDEISSEVVDRERQVYLKQVQEEGKPEHIQDRIVEGKLGKFFKENALVEQPFVKDPDTTIGELVGETKVRRFARYELGE
jgi:elongation factor Ts